MHHKLSTRFLSIIVFIFITSFRSVLAQYQVEPNKYYQASKYISLYFASSEKYDTELKAYYQHRYFEPSWLKTNGRLNGNAIELINYLQQHEYAEVLLKPSFIELIENYHKRIETKDNLLYSTLGTLDISLSNMFLQVARINLYGLINPEDLEKDTWHLSKRDTNLLAIMEKTAFTGKISTNLDNLLPKNTQYHELKKHLARYKFIKKHGGWPHIPEEILEVELGDTSNVVEILKERLIISGDMDAIDFHGLVYDEAVENGVKHFQYRHGLNEDGVVGKNTLFNLNISIEERIQQILLNIEKLKWLPENKDEKYLWVNIPSYKLKFFDRNKVIESQRVVVGSPKTPTPIFKSQISNVVFNPYWNVPYSIAKGEIAPKVSENTAYLLEKNYEVLNGWQDSKVVDSTNQVDWSNPAVHSVYRIRQKPGPSNALGVVKFNMPNKWSIYLHDTPSKNTFLRDKRAYSHGCIRLQQPVQLAYKVLGISNEAEKKEKIDEIIRKRSTETILISDRIPVNIIYYTAEIDEQGKLMLYEDVYGLDRKLNEKLVSILI